MKISIQIVQMIMMLVILLLLLSQLMMKIIMIMKTWNCKIKLNYENKINLI